MTMGIRRARFRDSFSAPALMAPGQVYQVVVDLQDLALTVRPGHRLRVIVGSSLYPHFALNLNNGGAMYVAGDTLVVRNTIHRSSGAPSYVLLASSLPSSVTHHTEALPVTPMLEQNYPNPFNPSTTIRFSIPKSSHTQLRVYDLLGREVQTLVDEELAAGLHKTVLDASRYPAGVYFYRIQSGTDEQVKKMMLIK